MIDSYVNRLSAPGGDGTTDNTVGVNRAFSTLFEAVSGDWLQLNVLESDSPESITVALGYYQT